jgi:hypothetical protein
MRGHKKNHSFIIGYIKKCFQNKILTSTDICEAAKNRVSIIEDRIKEIDALKKERSDLLDVLDHFKYKTNMVDKTELQFYSIQNKNIAIEYCKTVPAALVAESNDEIFCLKQMVYFKIFECFDGIFYPSINYDKFLAWSSCENKKPEC